MPRAALRGRQPWAPWCPARPLDKAAGTLSTEPVFAREHVSSKRARSRGFPTAGPAREQSCCRAAPPRRSLHQQSMRARRSARLMERRARLPHHTRSRAHFVGGALPGFLVDKSPLSLPACNRRVDGYPSPGLWEQWRVQGAQDPAWDPWEVVALIVTQQISSQAWHTTWPVACVCWRRGPYTNP